MSKTITTAGMNLAFTDERWQHVEREWDKFWNGEQNRPMVNIVLTDPATPAVPEHRHFFPQYPLSMSAEEIINIESRQLARLRWVGDAFPTRLMAFGPGSLSLYMGAVPAITADSVWFHHTADSLAAIPSTIDTGSVWFRRVQAILDCSLEAWGDAVQIVHSDVNCGLDILGALRGNEPLLLDFYDDPARVKELTQAITRAWIENYDIEANKIMSRCRGTANWGRMFTHGTTYMLQCDFSYNISPHLFEEYVVPDISALCDHLSDPFYHLDGKGALPHLDLLLSIRKLKGIQWVPGAGQPDASEWLDVLAKIRKAGKLCQIMTIPEGARKVVRSLGGKGFVFNIFGVHSVDEAEMLFKELLGMNRHR
jgi:5-methyltetrahydrofolate--homocysteine methyltransferase